MNDTIQQLEAQLAQVNKEIAELEAQKGMQTSQDSQPQSAPQPAQPNSAVFTNGATPQDNYFSWQYEVNQRKAQEKAQQDSTPKESYLSAQWEINQRKAQAQAQQPAQPKESYLKAQWEINQRKQNAQAQGAQNPSNNKTMTRFDLIKHKLENGIMLDPQEQMAMKAAGYDVKTLRGELQNRRTNINALTKEMAEIGELFRKSEVVLSRLREDGGFNGWLDRKAHDLTFETHDLSKEESEWRSVADSLVLGMAKLEYGSQLSNDKLKVMKDLYGVTGMSGISTNTGKMKNLLNTLINKGNLLISRGEISGVDIKIAKEFMQRLNLAQEHLGYLEATNSPLWNISSTYKDKDVKRYKDISKN